MEVTTPRKYLRIMNRSYMPSEHLSSAHKHDFASFEIINMDQTMCRFDMVPTRTNDFTGTKSIRITSTKAKKKGFTVALAPKGNGDKLPALVIFKERRGELGPRVKKALNIPRNICVKASTNGWMTTSLYYWWLQNVYKPDSNSCTLFSVQYKSLCCRCQGLIV